MLVNGEAIIHEILNFEIFFQMNPHYVCPIVQKIKKTHLKSGCENGCNRCNLLIINGFCGVGGKLYKLKMCLNINELSFSNCAK